MLYPMMQSVLLVCVEIDKQMPPQEGIVHCHWKSIVIHHPKSFWHSNFKFWVYSFKNWINMLFKFWTLSHALAHLRVSLLAQPTTPQCANQKPYRHGTDAPRHYPHTLIIGLVEGMFDVIFSFSSPHVRQWKDGQLLRISWSHYSHSNSTSSHCVPGDITNKCDEPATAS